MALEENKFLFTIITICFNASNEIEKTMDSVLDQSCDDFEYIIVDGLSSDGTQAVIQKKLNQKKNRIHTTFISEKDKGIYNAMNKGVQMATGHWVCFMNAGDVFISSKVLDEIKNTISNISNFQSDVIYGDTIIKDAERGLYKYRKAGDYEKLTELMPFFHQSSFTNRLTLKEYLFDEKYRICADHDLFLKLYLTKRNFFIVPFAVSVFSNDGVSCTGYESTIERTKMFVNNGVIPESEGTKRIRKLSLLSTFRSVIPVSVRNFRRNITNRNVYSKSNGWCNSIEECLNGQTNIKLKYQ